MNYKNIAIFASGSGSNAENIIRYFQNSAKFRFPLLVTNKSDAYVHERARKLQIPCLTLQRADFEQVDTLLNLLHLYQIDYIVLAGFLVRIPAELVQQFPNRIINIHPALLPKYGGKGMYGQRVHEAVKASGEQETGITIHYVNENYDEGAIILQERCDVLLQDTPETIAQKVHALEYTYYPLAIERIWG